MVLRLAVHHGPRKSLGEVCCGANCDADASAKAVSGQRALRALQRNDDFSSNWITSGLPTTRTSALTLYAS